MLDEVTGQLNDKLRTVPAARGETARAVTKDVVAVQVPYAYRLNPERYVLVAGHIHLREATETRSRYRRKLQEMLVDSKETVRAALRLEALGKEGILSLKNGLHSQHALVRFSSAEALAYLECPAGAEELARLAEQYEVLRVGCLTALAGMEESIAQVKLTELLSSSVPEVRYGAFRALRILDDRAAVVQGELLADTFWLHPVAPHSS